eukprot:5703097-Amphidinium_carterae.1
MCTTGANWQAYSPPDRHLIARRTSYSGCHSLDDEGHNAHAFLGLYQKKSAKCHGSDFIRPIVASHPPKNILCCGGQCMLAPKASAGRTHCIFAGSLELCYSPHRSWTSQHHSCATGVVLPFARRLPARQGKPVGTPPCAALQQECDRAHPY